MVQELYIKQSRRNPDGYCCPLLHCGKKFTKSCDLGFHFNLETGNMPYVCRSCGRAFRRASALQKHSATCCKLGKPRDAPSSDELQDFLKPAKVEADLVELVAVPRPEEKQALVLMLESRLACFTQTPLFSTKLEPAKQKRAPSKCSSWKAS